MKWVTRACPKTDRIACPWLIPRLIDPEAEIVYVAPDRVLATAAGVQGRSFDAPEADFTHRGDKCTFEVLIDEFGLGQDPALASWPASAMRRTSPKTSTPARSAPGFSPSESAGSS